MTEIDYGRLDQLESALGGRAAIEAAYRNGAVLLTKGDKGDTGAAGAAGATGATGPAGAGFVLGAPAIVGGGGLNNTTRQPSVTKPVLVIVEGSVSYDPSVGANSLLQVLLGLSVGGDPISGGVVAQWRHTRAAQPSAGTDIASYTLVFLVPTGFKYQIQASAAGLISSVQEMTLA